VISFPKPPIFFILHLLSSTFHQLINILCLHLSFSNLLSPTMFAHHANLGHALAKRALNEPSENWNLPSWAPLVAFADLIVFFPVFLIVGFHISIPAMLLLTKL
jgi:hypothetical protein